MVGVEESCAGSLSECVLRIKGHNTHFTVVATVGMLKALVSVAMPKKWQKRGKFLLTQSLQMLIHRPSDKLHVAGLSLWDVLGSHLASL